MEKVELRYELDGVETIIDLGKDPIYFSGEVSGLEGKWRVRVMVECVGGESIEKEQP